MLDSIPGPFQTILYPLSAGMIILALGRLLPGWIRRLLATAALLATLLSLWSLGGEGSGRMELFWEPLNFFRISPTLHLDSLSLLTGLTLTGVSAAMALGIQGSGMQKPWHGMMLIAVAGSLITAMAANLPTMALGSALIDLMLVALVLLARDNAEQGLQVPLTAALPGLASTLLLVLSSLRMSAQVGHTSLLAQSLPEGVLVQVGVAGALRLMVFPLHPRKWNSPEMGAVLLMPIGVGIYVLARVQVLAPVLSSLPWMLTAGGVALAAGALLTWSGNSSAGVARFWPGILVYQAGCALVVLIQLGGTAPWSLLALTLPLGALTILWERNQGRDPAASSRWPVWLRQRIQPWWTKARSLPALERWRGRWWTRYAAIASALAILASLAGVPLTVGARVRWPLYATLLKEGDPLLLLVLVADVLLAAGLWTRSAMILDQADDYRLRPTALISVLALVILVVALGIAPGLLGNRVGLTAIDVPDVSRWGLGLVFLLPWLLGAWLARVRSHLESYLDPIWRIANLDWLYRAVAWIGQRLVGTVHWLGQVGEGEGWWGWTLIILALGIILVGAR